MYHRSIFFHLVISFFGIFNTTTAQNWSGTYLNLEQNCTLILQQTASSLKGSITVKGEVGQISGNIQDAYSTGKIDDKQDIYTYEAIIQGNELTLAFTSEKMMYIPITLVFQRQKTAQSQNAPSPSTNNNSTSAATIAPSDQRIIGTWRYTEVMSSGSGSNYFSMATDYFIQFDGLGNCATWVGNSAGGGADSGFSSGAGQKNIGQYKISGSQIIFIDPATKQEVTSNYYIDANRIMLSAGGTKRVYERIE